MKQQPPIIRYRRDLWQVLTVPGDAAEVGVAEGYFANDMLNWPFHFPRVYLVDRWCTAPWQKGDASNPQQWHDTNLQQARDRVKIHGDRAIFLRGDSVEMAKLVPDHSLTLVNIDGDHSYGGVVSDIYAWFPKLKPGGVMAFHDYENTNYGVKRAVNEFCKATYEIHLLPEDKPDDAGAYFVVC